MLTTENITVQAANRKCLRQTVMIKSVFLTSIVDGEESRDVAVVDIPGAYMHANVDEYIIIFFD